jgi:hypothetical protein
MQSDHKSQTMIHVQNINASVAESKAPAEVFAPRPYRPITTRELVNFCGDVPAEEVRQELAAMLGSRDFPCSERNRRVLQYIVECALQGRWDDITAYNIATRVYERGEDFDVVKDPIVRIEMSRLRRDMEMYYLKAGRRSPLRFSIPKGRYFPQVVRATAVRPAAESATASPFLVSVLRASLAAWSGAPDAASAAWQDLLLADPALLSNLHESVAREVGDEEVTKMIVEGVLRAARNKT